MYLYFKIYSGSVYGVCAEMFLTPYLWWKKAGITPTGRTFGMEQTYVLWTGLSFTACKGKAVDILYEFLLHWLNMHDPSFKVQIKRVSVIWQFLLKEVLITWTAPANYVSYKTMLTTVQNQESCSNKNNNKDLQCEPWHSFSH